jgi:uncharacterized protein (TIGR02246 family)
MRGIGKAWPLLAAAAAASLSGCQRYESHEGEPAKVDVAAVENAIRADQAKWNDEFKAKNLDGLVAHYTPDAFFVAPGVEPAKGSKDIREVYEEALKDPAFAATFTSDTIDVAQSGDLAYVRGHFTETFTHSDTNKPTSDSGAYVMIYKKQPDGSW